VGPAIISGQRPAGQLVITLPTPQAWTVLAGPTQQRPVLGAPDADDHCDGHRPRRGGNLGRQQFQAAANGSWLAAYLVPVGGVAQCAMGQARSGDPG